MIDPYVIDQCDGDPEAIDSALKEAQKNRKKYRVRLIAHLTPKSEIGDYFEDNDWEDDWEDEIFND